MKKILFLLLIFPNIVLSQKETTVKEFYDNGQLKRETTYIDGLENGVELEYYENGQLSMKVHWLKGKWEGYFYSYYKDGSLQSKSYYKNGEEDGESIWYYSNGQIHGQCKYKNGKKHGYYKDFQDEYGIKMEVIRHGKYKSAVEPYLENEMSSNNRYQIKTLLNDI